MAQKRYDKKIITQDETTVMTVPAAKTDTVIGMSVANVSGVATEVTVKVAGIALVKNGVVEAGSTLVPIGAEQKLVMKENESMTVKANNAVDVMVSVVENG